jgi:hypothetical protein
MRRTLETTMRRLGMRKIVLFGFGLMAASMAIAACTDLTGPKSPETPINVTATLLSNNSVLVKWDASPQSDGVISYNIIRNGTKVAETTSTEYTDTGLAQQTTYTYAVSANCTSGVLSEESPVTAASTVTTIDVTPPQVIGNQPPNLFTAVSIVATMTATFSEPMDQTTINNTTFALKVTSTGALVPATVTYNPTTRLAELKPTNKLSSLTNYTATVTTGAKDLAGNGLASAFTWTFTTLDETAPTVIANTPANTATGVSATTPNITVTFSEPMNPNSIGSGSFTVVRTSNGAAVAGTVAYNAATRVASFTPSAPLLSGTGYTVTVASTVADVAGNPLGQNFVYTFTTGDATPPTITSTTPANLATGVPTSTTVTATFSEAMDATTINATNFTLKVFATNAPVAGTVTYNPATNTATFTPTAALSPSTAYVAAVSTGAKDLAGNALGANAWTFTTAGAPTVIATTPTNLATNVPTSTTLTATFSEAMDQTTISATTFTLRVTATSAAVIGTVSYNPATNTATFTPSVPLSPTTVYTATITTGAKSSGGTALASPFSWTFSTVDNVPPTVAAVSPLNGATGVSTGTVVNVTFSEAMDPATINGTTITLKNTNTSAAVAGAVTFNGTNIATFTPNVPLAPGTGYTVTVTTGVKDLAGNAMAAQVVSTFTTQAAPDTTAPTVASVSPANTSTTAPPNTKVYVTFSEPMDPTTINGTTVTLRVTSPSAAVAGTVSYNAGMNMAIFTPTSPLAATGYTVTVTTGVEDVAGNALASQFTSTFTSTAGPDATAPTVTGVVPASGATGVSVNSAVTVTFSEGMDPTTINGTTITLKNTVTSAAVAGTVSYNSTTNVATFTPTSALTAGTGYTVTVTTGVKDLAGNAMAAQVTSTFTTAP